MLHHRGGGTHGRHGLHDQTELPVREGDRLGGVDGSRGVRHVVRHRQVEDAGCRARRAGRGDMEVLDQPNELVMSITDTGVLAGSLETYTLTLDGKGHHTEMTLAQSGGNLTDDEYERAKAGTESFMDSMEAKVLPMLKARHDAM